MIVVIDYDVGNIGSILNMLKKVGAPAVCSGDIHTVEKARKLILPGVGSYDRAITKLNTTGLLPVLNRMVLEDRTPVLGICLGMQLFAHSSEEGTERGLGWLQATVKRFEFVNDAVNLKVPHMGWNWVEPQKESRLISKMHDDSRFYFAHSYHVECQEKKDVLGLTRYGYPFVSMIQKENVFGVQFHPEKSHKYGMQIFKNFVESC